MAWASFDDRYKNFKTIFRTLKQNYNNGQKLLKISWSLKNKGYPNEN